MDNGLSNSGKNADIGRTILIVEDDKFLRDILVHKFEEAGFEVNAATAGEEAFKMLERSKPDIVSLDLIMPGVDGFQVIERLKSNLETANIPILILSNLTEKGEIDRAMAAGAAGYMVKALTTPNEIVARAKAILAQKS